MPLMRNTRKSIRKLCEKPLAAPGLISYRYRGDYGYVMIGARDISDALYEAMRSTGKTSALSRLEVWNGNKYQPVDGA